MNYLNDLRELLTEQQKELETLLNTQEQLVKKNQALEIELKLYRATTTGCEELEKENQRLNELNLSLIGDQKRLMELLAEKEQSRADLLHAAEKELIEKMSADSNGLQKQNDQLMNLVDSLKKQITQLHGQNDALIRKKRR